MSSIRRVAQRVHPRSRVEAHALSFHKGGVMATMGPEDRERFARRDEAGSPVSSIRRDPEPEREKSAKVVAGGSIVEALCGAATVVLAIIGLAGSMPGFLMSVATIVFGVALI